MMFDEQILLHKDQSENAFPHEKRALKDNYEILQKRLKMLHDKREELAKNLRAVNEYNRELDLEMNSLKPEIIELYKQREQHQSWLLSHGARVEEVHKLLDQSRKEMAHNDEKAWLMPSHRSPIPSLASTVHIKSCPTDGNAALKSNRTMAASLSSNAHTFEW